ncbi:MAG TPA: hypothetical protein ENN33_08700 [Ignavibacteria bacterium]|nr:hypothetical protein [Ignavibacteria bacterium]
MIHKSKTYRSIVYLLPLIYIFSFLLSPYFHHHADELSHNDHHKFHSHLFENSHDDHSGEETHSHNLDESTDHHFHFVKLSSATTITTKRVEQNFVPITFLDLSSTNEEHNYNKRVLEKKPINFLLRDRCVQTATNVSPPLA